MQKYVETVSILMERDGLQVILFVTMAITMEVMDAVLAAGSKLIMTLVMNLDLSVLLVTEKPPTIVTNGVEMEEDLTIPILLTLEETCLDLWSGLVMTEIYDRGMAAMTIAELKKDFFVMEEQL